jgi:hypothetical protein
VLNKLLDLAIGIVANLSEETQQRLLDNLTANLVMLAHERVYIIEKLTEITTEEAESLAIIEEEGLGLVLYERRQEQWIVLTSQASAQQRADQIVKESTREIIYFLGIGFGEEVVAWYRHTKDNLLQSFPPGFVPAIYLFEPTAVYFLLFLLTGDRRELLADKRFYAFIGEQAFDDYYQLAISELINYSPKQLTYSFAPNRETLALRLKAMAQVITDHYDQVNAQVVSEMSQYYDSDFAKRVAQKIKEKRYSELRILGSTTRYTSFLQYGTRDLLSGFADLGCQIELDIEPSNYYLSNGQETLSKIYTTLPDIIFGLDFFRLDVVPKHIPCHTWIQDELERLVNPKNAALTRYDFVDVLGTGWQQQFAQRPYYQQHPVGVLPLGFHEDTYFPIEGIQKDIDVLYVSHLYDPNSTLAPYRLGKSSISYTQTEWRWLKASGNIDLFVSVMRTIGLALDSLSMNSLLSIVSCEVKRKEWLLSLNISEMTDSLLDILLEPVGQRGRISNDIYSQLKYRPMQALAKAGINIALYGKYWESIPELASFANGVAANGESLNILHNRSKICINCSAKISFHMRAVEIMASGAFMLSRRIPLDEDIMPITQLFKEDVEVVMFDNEQELVKQVNYYLSQPELCQTIAQSALLKLKEKHSYQHRAQQILDDIEQRFTVV